jgi:hypothetical protein
MQWRSKEITAVRVIKWKLLYQALHIISYHHPSFIEYLSVIQYLSRLWTITSKIFCLLTYLLTYLLTPWNRVLLEKLVKNFPAFYETQKFITAFRSACHLSLSLASSIQSIPPQPTAWGSILISSSHLRPGLPSGLILSEIFWSTKKSYSFEFLKRIWGLTRWGVQLNMRHPKVMVKLNGKITCLLLSSFV